MNNNLLDITKIGQRKPMTSVVGVRQKELYEND